GSLIISAPTALVEADIVADVISGSRQTDARPAGVTDGYKQVQNAVPLAGTFALGQYDARGLIGGVTSKVTFDDVAKVTAGRAASDVIPTDRAGNLVLDTGVINAAKLGGLNVASDEEISVNAPLVLASGGVLTFAAPAVNVNADITAHGGKVTLGNIIG